MKPSLIFIVLLIAFASCARQKQATGDSSFSVQVHINADGTVNVEETISLSLKSPGNLTRQLPMVEGSGKLLLRQRITDLSVWRGKKGETKVRHRLRAGDYWTNIDLLGLPAGEQVLHLKYKVLFPFLPSGSSRIFPWQFPSSFWNLTVKDLAITWHLPAAYKKEAIKLKNIKDYRDAIPGTVTHGERHITFTATGIKNKPDSNIRFDLTFPKSMITGNAPPLVSEYLKQGGITIFLLAFLVFLALVALFLPARAAINLTSAVNFLYPLALMASLWPSTMYWLQERHFRPGSASDPMLSVIVNAVFVLFFLFFALLQRRGFQRWTRTSYSLQLAIMPLLFIPALLPGTGLHLFGLLGIPILIYWHRREIAWQFGAGVERVVEAVNTHGEITFADLAGQLNLTKPQLEQILRQNADLPLVPDYRAGKVFSMENVKLAEDFKVCPSCGGGSTLTAGQSRFECAYCGTNFYASGPGKALAAEKPTGETKTQNAAATKSSDYLGSLVRILSDPFGTKTRPEKPVPFAVDGVAAFFTTIALACFFYALLFGVVFLGLEVVEGDGFGSGLVLGGVTMALLGAVGVGFISMAEKMRKGGLYIFLQILMVLTAPTLVSLVVLRKLWTPLCKLHFGAKDPKTLEAVLKARGELSLQELAAELHTSYGEAAGAAAYLAGNAIKF
ncbi:hypothetical protein KKF84_20870, partial [Myxococcota bacterium]|nr:hypothetical protein [Myxococcota bacterium]